MIGIIDYGAGNIKSLSFALDELQIQYEVTDRIDILDNFDKLILPGVGHANFAIKRLNEKGLTDFLVNTKQDLLGICLGMQLLFTESEETEISLLNVIPGKVRKFLERPETHMGWNNSGDRFYYYVHKYYAEVNEYTLETCRYLNTEFSSVVKKDNFTAVQFHPEKSAGDGMKLLKQYCKGSL